MDISNDDLKVLFNYNVFPEKFKIGQQIKLNLSIEQMRNVSMKIDNSPLLCSIHLRGFECINPKVPDKFKEYLKNGGGYNKDSFPNWLDMPSNEEAGLIYKTSSELEVVGNINPLEITILTFYKSNLLGRFDLKFEQKTSGIYYLI